MAAADAAAGASNPGGGSAQMQLCIPPQNFTAVEYPGYVRDVPKALHAMGGEASVPAAAAAPSKGSAHHQELLRLSLRPDQPHAHPLFAYPKPTRALLLRISQPRTPAATGAADAAAPQAQGLQVRVEGVVRTSLQFRGLADYQYVASPSLAGPTAATQHTATAAAGGQGAKGAAGGAPLAVPPPPECAPDRAEPSGVAQPLLCLPLLFSKLDAPLMDFPWKNAAAGVMGQAGQAGLKGARRAHAAEVVSYHDDLVPALSTEHAALLHDIALQQQQEQQQEQQDGVETTAEGAAAQADAAAAPAQPQEMPQGRDQDEAEERVQPEAPASVCLRRVAELLVQRPVWPLALLHEHLAAVAVQGAGEEGAAGGPAWRPIHVDQALARLAYRFKSGPWRGLYIRRGYDPRRDAGSWQHQAVHYTLPRTWYQHTVMRTLPGVQRPVPPTMAAISRLQALPTSRTVALQLCDLLPHASPELQAACAAADARSQHPQQQQQQQQRAPSPTTGWFTADEWRAVERAVADGLNALIPQDVPGAAGQGTAVAAPPGTQPAAAPLPQQQQQQQQGLVDPRLQAAAAADAAVAVAAAATPAEPAARGGRAGRARGRGRGRGQGRGRGRSVGGDDAVAAAGGADDGTAAAMEVVPQQEQPRAAAQVPAQEPVLAATPAATAAVQQQQPAVEAGTAAPLPGVAFSGQQGGAPGEHQLLSQLLQRVTFQPVPGQAAAPFMPFGGMPFGAGPYDDDDDDAYELLEGPTAPGAGQGAAAAAAAAQVAGLVAGVLGGQLPTLGALPSTQVSSVGPREQQGQEGQAAMEEDAPEQQQQQEEGEAVAAGADEAEAEEGGYEDEAEEYEEEDEYAYLNEGDAVW